MKETFWSGRKMSDLTTKETKYLIKLSCEEIEDIIIELGKGRDLFND